MSVTLQRPEGDEAVVGGHAEVEAAVEYPFEACAAAESDGGVGTEVEGAAGADDIDGGEEHCCCEDELVGADGEERGVWLLGGHFGSTYVRWIGVGIGVGRYLDVCIADSLVKEASLAQERQLSVMYYRPL